MKNLITRELEKSTLWLIQWNSGLWWHPQTVCFDQQHIRTKFGSSKKEEGLETLSNNTMCTSPCLSCCHLCCCLWVLFHSRIPARVYEKHASYRGTQKETLQPRMQLGVIQTWILWIIVIIRLKLPWNALANVHNRWGLFFEPFFFKANLL